MSQQCALAAKRANHTLEGIKHNTGSQSREVTVPPYTALVPPHHEYSVQCCVPQYKQDIKVLECVQRRVIKMMKGLKGKIYKEGLRAVGLFSLEKRKVRGEIITVGSFHTGGNGEGGADLFLVGSDKTQGNGMKLHRG